MLPLKIYFQNFLYSFCPKLRLCRLLFNTVKPVSTKWKKEMLYSWTDLLLFPVKISFLQSLMPYVSAELVNTRFESLTVFPTWKRSQIVLFDLHEVLRTLQKRNINFEKISFDLCSGQGYKMHVSCCLKSVSSLRDLTKPHKITFTPYYSCREKYNLVYHL